MFSYQKHPFLYVEKSVGSCYTICTHIRTYKGGGLMINTRIFQNGNSQAMRIPQEYRTEKKDYCITKIGDIFIACPSDDPWAPTREVLGTFSPDFMIFRDQPDYEKEQRAEL